MNGGRGGFNEYVTLLLGNVCRLPPESSPFDWVFLIALFGLYLAAIFCNSSDP